MPGITSQLSSGKVNHFGIEAVTQLSWTGWEPGKEFTKSILFKNVRVKTQKLKFLPPKSRFFTTMYPQPIMLSPGTSFSLPVTFRPVENITYDDSIEFITNEGHFIIQLKALLPQHNITVPDQVHLGMCAINDVVSSSFEVRNTSELCTPFQVLAMEPFIVEPSEGFLQPFSSTIVTASFQPQEAVVCECVAVIRYGEEWSCTACTRLIGLGKYPHFGVTKYGVNNSDVNCCKQSVKDDDSPRETVLNFGSVAVGLTVEGFVEITNQSPVPAPFRIESPMVLPSDAAASHRADQRTLDRVFHCRPKSGKLPPFKSTTIQVQFSPNTVGRVYTEYFHILSNVGTNKTVVKCIASGTGPELCLSQGMINFHMVKSCESATKALEIVNKSCVPATFQFMIDSKESVFKFDKETGTVAAKSQTTILVHFKPVHAMNYYRKVSCIVHNQGVLSLELLGTCHRDSEQPPVLQPMHIHRYQLYVERELSFIPPECLNTMLADGKMGVDSIGALYPAEKVNEISTDVASVVPPIDDYFNDGHHSEFVFSPQHVSLDVNYVNFGQVSCTSNIVPQTVSLTNHTQGRITVMWTGGLDSRHVFSVSPACVEIPPQKSASFNVLFKPTAVDRLYSAELECYAQYKSMRDYGMIDDKTHFPPWCLTLSASGHTFQSNIDAFVPKWTANPLEFPLSVVNEHESAFRTVLYANTGSTPILIDVGNDDTTNFGLKPMRGIVQPGEHQIFVVKYAPTGQREHVDRGAFRLFMNDGDKYCQELVAYGSVELPEVVLDNCGMMYFKPTCVGTSSTRQYAVQNISRLPICYEWKMKHSDSSTVSVTPACGVLQPNEVQFHRWTFRPPAETKYMVKAHLAVWSQAQPGYRNRDGKVMQHTLRAIGEGACGRITTKETCIDVGPLVVGSVTYRHLTLVNDSTCSLYYKLCVTQTVRGPYTDDGRLYDDTLCIQLNSTEGVLAARATCDVLLTIRPMKRVSYRWNISYTLQPPESDCMAECAATLPSTLCDVVATGVYPTLVVTDSHGYGSAAGLSKKQLWNLFSLDNLNMFLDGDPSASELTYGAPTRHSHERRPAVYTRAIVDINFSAAPVGSEPCVVQLKLENNCPVPCDWAFLFPQDQQLELEYWAETGEFTVEELHELKIMDNKLFFIEPNKGKLCPGESCCISFSYKHTMVGTDRLPVVLKLTRGREILLHFVGETVEVDRPYIHFPSTRHMFAPVPIGETRSPVQTYEMYNGGALPVSYEIDVSPLQLVYQENYGHAVFECLDPKGCINPGQTVAVRWRFSPLEARTYMVDIPIQIDQGEKAVITFTGIGFDKRLMGTTMELNDVTQQTGVPCIQSVMVPGQTCYLSCERVSLGNVPLLSSVHRIVVLKNTSAEHSVGYVWHVTDECHAQFVTVYPRSDKLGPGESAVCKITFFAVGQPAFFDIDLICETTLEKDYNEYLSSLSAWENERERQKYEFTITEKDINADKRVPSPEERPSSVRLKALCRTGSPDVELVKYRTLPPIMKQSASASDIRLSQKEQKKFTDCFWPKPDPPKPFMLHLGLTARTHDIAEFRQHFGDDFKRFCLDRTLAQSAAAAASLENDTVENSTTDHGKTVICRQAEADMISLVVQTVIRSLVDDAQFHDACCKVSNEPIPYFQQFGNSMPLPAAELDDIDLSSVPPPPDELLSQVDSASTMKATVPPGSISSTAQSVVGNRTAQLAPSTRGTSQEQLGQNTLTDESSKRASPSAASGDRLQAVQQSEDVELPVVLSSCASSVQSFFEQPVQVPHLSPSQHQLVHLAEANYQEKFFTDGQRIKTLPEFGSIAEMCLENTIMNIVQEAFKQEFNITARPRLVALPPRPNSAGRQMHAGWPLS